MEPLTAQNFETSEMFDQRPLAQLPNDLCSDNIVLQVVLSSEDIVKRSLEITFCETV